MTATDIPRSLGDPDILAAYGLRSKRAPMQARRRNRHRIAAGSQQEPFPDPAMRTGGSKHYWVSDVASWHDGHTVKSNPSRHPRSHIVPVCAPDDLIDATNLEEAG